MSPSFTSEYAYVVLKRACQAAGLASDGAELLRLGENAIFRLSGQLSQVVARVSRDMSRYGIAQRELCVSRWLNGAGGVRAARVHEDIADQPLVVDGHPVTFWQYVEAAAEAPTVVDLAHLLRELHAAGDSPCELPVFDPLGTVRPRLEQGLGLSEADQEFVQARCDVIDRRLADLQYFLPPGPIHGDAHVGDLLGRAGSATLTDFEVFAVGPREWDLVPVAVGVTRLCLASRQWEAFVAAYGFDVRAWSGYPVFREIREVGTTTWLAQNAGESDAIAREVALRLRCLRDGDLDRAWTAF